MKDLCYVLFSQKDSRLYYGYTKDLNLRIKQHINGEVQSTKHRRPLKLIYYEACLNKDDAIRREKYFKTHYGRMFLKKRLKEYFQSDNSYSIGHVKIEKKKNLGDI